MSKLARYLNAIHSLFISSSYWQRFLVHFAKLLVWRYQLFIRKNLECSKND